MKIFIDTNIFYNDWFMRSANFKYLFHFINNDGHSLIISELVIQEAENIRERELSEALNDIESSMKKMQKLNANKLSYDAEKLGIEGYNLTTLLQSRAEDFEIIGYDEIPHSEVVMRALHNKKPFLEGEKGYRDTLIWLSLIDYLVKKNESDDVVFITQNKSDFFKVIDKTLNLHPDLASDLKQKGVCANIRPFASLFDFINSTVDKDRHAIDFYKSEEIFERFIEDSSVLFFEELSNIGLGEYLESSIFETKVKDILDIRAEVFEGIEDPQVMQTKRLSGNEIYVGYQYNLRGFVIEVDIPEIDYTLNKDELERVFYDAEVKSGVATLICYARAYFIVSFIYNEVDEELKNFEVDSLLIRR